MVLDLAGDSTMTSFWVMILRLDDVPKDGYDTINGRLCQPSKKEIKKTRFRVLSRWFSSGFYLVFDRLVLSTFFFSDDQ